MGPIGSDYSYIGVQITDSAYVVVNSYIMTRMGKKAIDQLKDNTFHAKIVIALDGKTKNIDARPSDSIALAVRTKSRIFVEEEVLNKSTQFSDGEK